MSTHQTIGQAITQANQIMVIAHIDPDGDALGSLTALGAALTAEGKQVALVCDDGIANRFAYLPMSDQVQRSLSADAKFDLIITLDCADEQRAGRVYAQLSSSRPTLINIDHHVTNTKFGDINLVDSEATSTAEVLYDLLTDLNLPITADVALGLLTGLVTDTRGFRTVNVTARTLRIASRLVEIGADLNLVVSRTLTIKSLSTVRLWQTGLSNMKMEDGLIWVVISNEDRKASGHSGTSTAGLVNLVADVEQAAMGAVLMEMGDGSVRVGWRCRPPYNVSEVARNLGGGGHALAAGCTLSGPLAKAEKMVVALSKEAIQQQESLLTKNGQN